ncbi:MAG: hypothetical protein ACKVYV_05680 [Limisphaerales bacterium]
MSPAVSAVASAAAEAAAPAAGRRRCTGVFLLWLGLYLTLVLAWGQRNSWPDHLLVCLLFLPLQVAVAASLHARHGFGRDGRDEPSHRELAIAYLLLATGIASGLLLMMTVGLLAVGVAWLRPRERPVNWFEWLKLPVVFSFALPFWLDFSGSRQDWFAPFDDPAVNPAWRLPLELGVTRLQVALRFAVLAAALLLPGRSFWWALPLLAPAVVAGNEAAVRLAAGSAPAAWGLMAAALLAVAAFARGLDRRFGAAAADGHVRYWMEHRAYPPWIAAMAVAVQQTAPAEGPALRPLFGLALLGAAAMVVLLYRLRLRTPAGPIHSRSSGLAMAGLALLLGAEFTGLDLLRYAALGATIIGLMSWHRLWAKRVFLAAAVAWMALMPPTLMGVMPEAEPAWLVAARAGVALASLALLAMAGPRTDWASGEEGYANEAWMPIQRFALIFLILMVVFQNASAFWPEPMENRFEQAMRGATATDLLAPPERAAATDPLAVTPGYGKFEVTVSLPSRNPAQLEAPELALRRRGWVIRRREVVPHPFGTAVALELELERNQQPARAVYWFENDGEAFANYLQARRILWSSWNLSDRNLRLVMILSGVAETPGEFIAFARQQHWFAAPR